jgi:predicted nucleic acid-binding Zn finger protein
VHIVTTIDLADPRTQRAIEIAADAGQWLRCTRRDGQRLFGIPSQRRDVHYLASGEFCSCPDQKYQPTRQCKHMLAIRIHQALAK